jgi:EAL domain-containing protein (putative c-di-GMP-specific phosphodiesterase class I)
MFVYGGDDERPVAANDAALDLLGYDADTFFAGRLEDHAALRHVGRHQIDLRDGSTATVEVSHVEGWWAPGPARLVVARDLGVTETAPAGPLVERLLDALGRQEGNRGHGVAVLFVDPSPGGQGDAALVEAMAARLRQSVRRTDLVCHVGDGRLAVVCEPVHGEIEAAGLAAALVDDLALLASDVSIGVALAGEPGLTLDDLRRDPVEAVAAAETKGRARHAAFTDVRSRRQLGIAQSLRRAIDTSELEVHYQPLVDLRNDTVLGIEALVRWRPEGSTPVPPAQFIPVAERAGLIGEVSDRVLSEACRFAADRPDLRVAVNMSRVDLSHDLLRRVMRAVEDAGLTPARLTVELTEAAVLDDLETASDVLRTLTQQGVHIALDDFGTGTCSLQVLRRLPFDSLKVDRSVVRSVADTPADRALVDAVVGLARAAGGSVTAEGVETAEQAAVLADMGCDDAQGFLFAPPMSRDDCEEWLARPR